MRKGTDWLFGYFRLTITGASPSWYLNRLTKAAIPFWNIYWKDEFTVTISVYRRDLDVSTKLASSSMCQTEAVYERGLPPKIRTLRRRICLLALLITALLAAVIVPRFVWFYEVEGNVSIPAEKICSNFAGQRFSLCCCILAHSE